MTAPVTGISSSADSATNASADTNGTSGVQASAPAPAPKANNSTSQQDDVKLSLAAQAKTLHEQGETIQQIAEYLGCTTKQIDTYLGITPTAGSSGRGATQYSSSQVAQLLNS